MKRNTFDLTQEQLKELVIYDPITGNFISKVNRATVRVGDVLGYKNTQGYVPIQICKRRCFAHRLAFLYMTGAIPETIDHINNNGYDNSWSNLRAATVSQNQYNSQISINNTTGVKGLSYNKTEKAYYAYIRGGSKNYRKSFACKAWGEAKAKELAITWLRETRKKLHGEFVNHG